jgi:hypothetical protein
MDGGNGADAAFSMGHTNLRHHKRHHGQIHRNVKCCCQIYPTIQHQTVVPRLLSPSPRRLDGMALEDHHQLQPDSICHNEAHETIYCKLAAPVGEETEERCQDADLGRCNDEPVDDSRGETEGLSVHFVGWELYWHVQVGTEMRGVDIEEGEHHGEDLGPGVLVWFVNLSRHSMATDGNKSGGANEPMISTAMCRRRARHVWAGAGCRSVR